MVLKIVCLNLWQGGNLFPGIINFLRQENADILGLQEVYNGTAPELADKYRSLEIIKSNLGYEYSDFAPAFLDNKPEGKIEQGNGCFLSSRLRVVMSPSLTNCTGPITRKR